LNRSPLSGASGRGRRFRRRQERIVRIVSVVAARPNYMKAAPILSAMRGHPALESVLVHTGQHYSPELSGDFFRALGLPEADVNLEVGSGSHAVQTAEVMKRIEPVFERVRPDLVIVVGDVNSTLAAALVAAKLGIPIAHVEAGLRSFDRTMPEEINRVLTDQISSLLFTTEPSAERNLVAEGISRAHIHFVGNTMIDTLLATLSTLDVEGALGQYGVERGRYALVTLHRPGNVDEAEPLRAILEGLAALGEAVRGVPADGFRFLFPVHPRTEKNLKAFGLTERASAAPGLTLMPPLPYPGFLALMSAAALVMTDSGGIQEETTVLGVPCLTLRENTERPITVEQGTNVLVGRDTEKMVRHGVEAITGGRRAAVRPELWDGRAAERIVSVILQRRGS
jgi:UDP-N-acetylglucosamine 2-epimerase (non-hydrolysing)